MRDRASVTRQPLQAALLGVLGIGFVVWGGMLVSDAMATRAWPTATGTITASALDTDTDPDDGDTMYTVNVRYTYTAGARVRTGHRISLGDHSSSSYLEMQRLIDRYPVGRTVAVAYDPRAPGTALLQTGPVWITWIPLLFGLLATVLGLTALVRALRRR